MVKLIHGRLVVSSPFCSGNLADKSFRAHPWLPMDKTYQRFRCPVCNARGEV